ncbi:MAG TPA: serine/threonine-protein kinase, partial [Thermoanaerobaculia bacterium]
DRKIKRNDAIPVARKVEILLSIADGLAYAHNASIVHRDIKPANVRVLDDGTVKIMDFGIAKSLETNSNLTQTGITLGTSAYLAPEQIRGEPIDRRTDIFSFGILAYELMTMRKPFRGEHLSTVLYKILNETPDPVSSIAPDVPEALSRVVARAMEKDPWKRHPTMEAVRADLEAAAAGLSAAPPTVPFRTAPFDPDATMPTPSHGLDITAITPPSGALARQPEPAPPSPPSAPTPIPSMTPRPSVAASSARGLELVDFGTTGERPSVHPPHTPSRRPVLLAGIAVGLLLAVSVGYFSMRAGRGTQAAAVPTPAAQAALPTALPAELPTPVLGVDAPPEVKPTAAPAPTAAPVMPPAPKSFPVQFSSLPPGTFWVDGKKIGPSIPAKTLELAEGTHKVRFQTEGFPDHEMSFTVGPGGKDSVFYKFPVGVLRIDADAAWSGANVFVDRRFRGNLPAAARLRLPTGSYSLMIQKDGFRPATGTVQVSESGEAAWAVPPPVPVDGGN